MVVMVVDHARDFWSRLGNPEAVGAASTALFLTRWITHFCAPAFVLLAGVAASLRGASGRSRGELARFLFVRGLVLLALEATVVSFGWLQSLEVVVWQVIAAIGVAMVALAGFVFAPRWLTAAFGLALVAGQDLYVGLGRGLDGAALDVWRLLQGGLLGPSLGVVHVGSHLVIPIYPVLPWIGVMLLGYTIGPWFRLDADARRRRLAWTGFGLLALFVVVRGFDGFGNARPWGAQAENGPAWQAWLVCQKYPPSLAYLLMTLGPVLLLLRVLDGGVPRGLRWLSTFGRVPLFFYVAHLYVLHCGARLWFWLSTGEPVSLLRAEFAFLAQIGLTSVRFEPLPDGFVSPGLVTVYAVSAATVLCLWPACRRLAERKRRTRAWWLSYL